LWELQGTNRKMKWPSNLLSPVLAFLAACALSPATVMGADDPQATKAVATGNPASTEKPPMIIENPNGTFTVQKTAPKETAKDPNTKKGLVIPPQVVVPIAAIKKRK
jgi:hypothetical protein